MQFLAKLESVAFVAIIIPSAFHAGSKDAILSVVWPDTKFKTMDCIITTDAKRDWINQFAVITDFQLDKTYGFACRALISENVNHQ